MRVISTLHPRLNGTNGASDFALNESGEVLVLKHRDESVLVGVPDSYLVRNSPIV